MINYSEIDLDLTIDDMLDLSDDETTVEDRWEFNSKQFRSLIQIFKSILRKNPFSQNITFVPRKHFVEVWCDGVQSILKYDLPVQNIDHVLSGPLSISLSTLEPLLSALPKNKVVIYKGDDGYFYMQLVGCVYPLIQDPNQVNPSIGRQDVKATVQVESLLKVFSSFLPYVNANENVYDRVIHFVEDGYAWAKYKWSQVQCEFQSDLPVSFILTQKNIQILKNLLNLTSSNVVQITESDDYRGFHTTEFSFYVVKENVEDYNHEIYKKAFQEFEHDSVPFRLNYQHFYHAVRFLEQNPFIQENVDVELKDNILKLNGMLQNHMPVYFRFLCNPVSDTIEGTFSINKNLLYHLVKAVDVDGEFITFKVKKDFTKIGLEGNSKGMMAV